MAVDTLRAELHDLVEALPEDELSAARRYLRFLGSGETDLFKWTLDTAAEEDEPVSPDEDTGGEEAWQEYLRGETMSSEEAKRLLLP